MNIIKNFFVKYWLDLLLLAIFSFGCFFVYIHIEAFNYNWSWQDALEGLFWFDEKSQSFKAGILIEGFIMTLKIIFWSSILALFVGIFVGIARISNILFFKMLSWFYVELIRNIPPLVFIFIFYFFISSQLMPASDIDTWLLKLPLIQQDFLSFLFVKPELMSNFISGVICLALLEAAYIAEIIRAGLQSINKGQWEASAACGMNWYAQVRLIILPQAMKKILPPLAGQIISLVKDSSILSVISIQELTFTTLEMAVSSRQIFESWIITAGIYFIVCFCFSLIFRIFEKRPDHFYVAKL